jgi:predicted nucleic acid-binding Zn ribbon protein
MPTYVYEVIGEDGQPGERFEVVQKMTDDPLSEHPETGATVRRVFVPFHVAGKNSFNADKAINDDSKLEKLGFTKYVKSGDGSYDKVVGEGPKSIQK